MPAYFYKTATKICRAFIVLLLIGAIASHHGKFLDKVNQYLQDKPVFDETPYVNIGILKTTFPQAEKYLYIDDPEKLSEILDQSGKVIGYFALTAPGSDQFTGYGGTTPLLILFDPEKKITAVKLLSNTESESFIERIRKKDLFTQWDRLTIVEAYNKEVDTITGATMSSSSIINSLKHRLAYLCKADQAAPQRTPVIDVKGVCSIAVIVFALLSFLFPAKFQKVRLLLLVSSVIILGFINCSMISLALIYNWAIQLSVPFLTSPVIVLIFVLAVVIPIFTSKHFYCMYLCPFGAFQEMLNRIFQRKPKLPALLLSCLKHTRALFLTILVFLLLSGVDLDLTYMEPFSAFLYEAASWSVLILAVAFLLLSLVVNRPWCNYFCPTRQVLEIIRVVPDAVEKENAGGNKKMRFDGIVIIMLIIVIYIILLMPGRMPGRMPGMQELTGNSAETPASVSGSNAGAGESERDIQKVIHARKSVRKYLAKAVSDEDIMTLLKAGMAAPTAANAQPWAFITVKDRETLVKLAGGLEYGKMLNESGAAIIVCGLPSKWIDKSSKNDWWIQDCSAATENILLMAQGLGLGAVWVGVHPVEERVNHVRQVLGIPGDVIPLNVISIGYPGGTEKPKNKFDAGNIHQEKW